MSPTQAFLAGVVVGTVLTVSARYLYARAVRRVRAGKPIVPGIVIPDRLHLDLKRKRRAS